MKVASTRIPSFGARYLGGRHRIVAAFASFAMIAAACSAGTGDEVVLRCDFAANTYAVDSEKAGRMHGVLPRGCVDNFSDWKAADVRTEVREEYGRRFLRFDTRTDAGGQFCFPNLRFANAGAYLIRVRARLGTAPALKLRLRKIGAPYSAYWDAECSSAEWNEEEQLFHIQNDAGESGRGLFLYTARGITDIESIEICKIREAAYRRNRRRPDASVAHLLKRYRFPLGLPAGWTVRAETGVACLDKAATAADGLATLGVAGGACTIYSEPFQTNEPDADHVATFQYKTSADCKLRVSVVRDNHSKIAEVPLRPSAEWICGSIAFKASGDAASFTLRFDGEGAFAIDRTDVSTKAKAADRVDEPTVTLSAVDGEIARRTRIQFADEPAVLRGIATDVPDGAEVAMRVTDLYGESVALKPISFPKGGKSKAFDVRYDVFGERPIGQFRVQAVLKKKGRELSREEEFVVTRVRRPVAWGRDAPESPFGSHFAPLQERLEMMKACGVNWMRLHDVGMELCGWWKIEPEKGRWEWQDDAIMRVRKAGVRIFAQLGTAPAWATHYGDLGCKRMGYFEKYLRPVDMASWTNYVTRYVARYAGKIDDYFIWNEPWGEWWSRAEDIKYYDKNRVGEDFGAFSRITYDAAKLANPKANICGINTAPWELPGSNWTARVCAGGGYAACDSMDFHVYTASKRLLRNEEPHSGMTFSYVRAVHPDDAKPIIMSEGQGAAEGANGGNGLRMSGMYSATVPWKAATPGEMALFSDKTCRYVIALLTERDVKRVFLYTTQGFESLGQKPSYQTLLGADGFPHPSFVAHAQMAAAIEGKRFVRRSDFGSLNGVRVDFAGERGTCRVYANLTDDELSALAAKTELHDLYGNRIGSKNIFHGMLVYETVP